LTTVGATGASGPGRPRRYSNDEILEVAERLLSAEGVAAISIRRIADELSCAPMTLYNGFGSKRDMLDHLARRLLARHDVLPQETLPLDERVSEWMWRFRRAIIDGRLFELFSDGPPLATLLAAVGDWIRQLSAEGWGEQPAAMQAQHLLWTVNGFCLTQAAAGTPIHPSAVKQLDPALRPWAKRYLEYFPDTDSDALFSLTVQATVAGMQSGAGRRISKPVARRRPADRAPT
jgi:AcrR family transcriptional regulator